MTTAVSRLLVGSDTERQSVADAGWLQWLSAHLDAAWRPGEWDGSLWLFAGDLDNDRTAAWRCRTPGCPTPAGGYNGHCASCRRSRSMAGVSEEQFDRTRRRRPTRPAARGGCAVPDCVGESHCRGLCFRHERAWRRAGGGPVEEFIASARPLIRTEPCLVAGCGRERVTRRGLCRFHGNRLQRQRNLASMSQEEPAAATAVRVIVLAHRRATMFLHCLMGRSRRRLEARHSDGRRFSASRILIQPSKLLVRYRHLPNHRPKILVESPHTDLDRRD